MDKLLAQTLELAAAYLAELPERHVGARATLAELRGALGGPLPAEPVPPEQVIAQLAEDADPGLVASAGPRYFGFVIGGSLPAAVAADWLGTAWDQNAYNHVTSPAAAVLEEVVIAWLLDLLALPATASAGLVTGAQMANVTGLAAARHSVLARHGWDAEADGLAGAPPIRVLAGEERHATIDRSLRMLGIGDRALVPLAADDQGRLRPEALAGALDPSVPTIVCAQAGNVNSGAVDPLGPICELARGAGAWVHVDGAFGLWAAASPRFRHLVEGAERADSWATDGHKMLNVPYDSGFIAVADPAAHRAPFRIAGSYLVGSGEGTRSAVDHNPESSRRARALPLYAALRSLGRSGVAQLVERCCDLARRFADLLGGQRGVEVCNDVVLNQVVVRFADDDARTRAVVAAVQEDGTCWLGGTTWRGRAAMRISVSNWSTTADDVDRSVDAILRAFSGTA